MESWRGFMMRKGNGFGGHNSYEDFEEKDVLWNRHHDEEVEEEDSSHGMNSNACFITQTTTTRNEAKRVVHQLQPSSAPMSIPDWSKIYGNTISASWANYNNHDDDDVDDFDDDDDDDMVPPHEWIAKKLARSQISSFSVCEGIGRTLKGRDLSNVRNTILAKTGFLE